MRSRPPHPAELGQGLVAQVPAGAEVACGGEYTLQLVKLHFEGGVPQLDPASYVTTGYPHNTF